ncbi:MAG: hypothetical protein V1928_03150 [Parcubacteria group bacterium]
MTTKEKDSRKIEIVNGPRQYAFLTNVIINFNSVELTLLIDKKQVVVDAQIIFTTTDSHETVKIAGFFIHGLNLNDAKKIWDLKSGSDFKITDKWTIYFTGAYNIQSGTGELYPFLLNDDKVKFYFCNESIRPAPHPFNDSVYIELPAPLKIIIEHQKELAIKKAVAEALTNAKQSESRPDESADKRIDELKNKISESDRGDKLSKQMLCWLLDETKLFTKPAGVEFPRSSAYDFGTNMLNNASDILNESSERSLLSPYEFDVDLKNGTLVIADFSIDPDLVIKLKEVNMDLLNHLSKIRFYSEFKPITATVVGFLIF